MKIITIVIKTEEGIFTAVPEKKELSCEGCFFEEDQCNDIYKTCDALKIIFKKVHG